MERKFLTREETLAADDLEARDLCIPEWGGWVRIRTLTAAEKDDLEIGMVMDTTNGKVGETKRLDNIRARFVAAAMVDQEGRKMYSARDIKALGKKSARALSRIFTAVQEMNGISDDDVEEMEKNFGRGRSDSSASGSAATSESGTSVE